MKKKLFAFFVTLLTFIVLDVLWFKLVSAEFFFENLKTIGHIQDNQLVVHYPSALAVYLLLSLGIHFFVLEKKKT